MLALAVLVGGGTALRVIAAPVLFRVLDRPRAGDVFGSILSAWDLVATASALVLALASTLIYLNFEQPHSALLARYLAVALAIAATLYASVWAGPLARGLRRETQGFDDLPANAPERREFARYHERSRRAMTVAIAAGLLALYLS